MPLFRMAPRLLTSLALLACAAASAVTDPLSVKAASGTAQTSSGTCSPNISNVAGSVTVQCSADVPADVVARLEKRLSFDAIGGNDRRNAAWVAQIRRAIREELLAYQLSDPTRHMLGYIETRVDQAPGHADIATELLIDRMNTGVYAGPLYDNIDTTVVRHEAAVAVIGFMDRLARVHPTQISVDVYLGEICPLRIRRECGQPRGLGKRSGPYGDKLAARIGELYKTLIVQRGVCPAEAVYVESHGTRSPVVQYPPEKTATAKAWEYAAAHNMRVVIGVSFPKELLLPSSSSIAPTESDVRFKTNEGTQSTK